MIFRQNLHTDTTGMPITETVMKGDVSLDGLINHTDFVRFKAIYDAANGEGAFAAAMAGVPEPSTWALAVAMAVCAGSYGRESTDRSTPIGISEGGEQDVVE